jgi:hypothetical protein
MGDGQESPQYNVAFQNKRREKAVGGGSNAALRSRD